MFAEDRQIKSYLYPLLILTPILYFIIICLIGFIVSGVYAMLFAAITVIPVGIAFWHYKNSETVYDNVELISIARSIMSVGTICFILIVLFYIADEDEDYENLRNRIRSDNEFKKGMMRIFDEFPDPNKTGKHTDAIIYNLNSLAKEKGKENLLANILDEKESIRPVNFQSY